MTQIKRLSNLRRVLPLVTLFICAGFVSVIAMVSGLSMISIEHSILSMMLERHPVRTVSLFFKFHAEFQHFLYIFALRHEVRL